MSTASSVTVPSGTMEGTCSVAELDRARFLFDLNGFVVVRKALSPLHVDALNGAVDRHAGGFRGRTVSARCAACVAWIAVHAWIACVAWIAVHARPGPGTGGRVLSLFQALRAVTVQGHASHTHILFT
jgi:hypothetical protein